MNQVIDPTGDEALDAIPVGDSGPARTIGLVLAWIGVAVVAVCAIWFVSSQLIGSDGGSVVERYASGKHVQLYESLRDQFKVELPTTPHRTERAEAGGRTVIVVSTPGPGYQFSVTRESAARHRARELHRDAQHRGRLARATGRRRDRDAVDADARTARSR